MGIRKRGNKWLVTAESGRDEFGIRRRVCRAVDTEEEAKRLDAKLQHDVYEGRHIKPSTELVPDFCQRFLDGRDKLAPATRNRYEGYLKHVRRDLAAVTLARFTPKVAVSWKRKQLESHLSSSTVRKHLVFVRAAMDRAVAWKLIAENPLRFVELPGEEPPPFHVYSPAEQAALLSAAAPADGAPDGNHRGRSDGNLYVPLVLDLATGLRRGELLGLRTTDVDLARSRIHVRQALRKQRDGSSAIGPCKTRRSRRTVVLPQSVADLLAEYAAQRPKTRSNTFFLTLAGTPYTLDGFESSWGHVRARAAEIMRRDAEAMDDPFAEEAGDELAVARFHDLRHTHATELLRAGVHIKIVAERLGDSEATVMRTYSHVLPDMQESAAAAVEPMLRGLLPRRRLELTPPD
jgi:integrase